jgi:hypothetical protein
MSWLQTIPDRAVTENMCVSPRCTTCGASIFRAELLSGAKRAQPRDMTARGWTVGTLKALAAGLAELPHDSPRDEEALRLIILHLHRMVGDRAFTEEFAPGFGASPAAKVLATMKSHKAANEARRSAHAHRNCPDGIAEARERRKAAGERRAAEHRARKEARDAERRQRNESKK